MRRKKKDFYFHPVDLVREAQGSQSLTAPPHAHSSTLGQDQNRYPGLTARIRSTILARTHPEQTQKATK